MHYFKIIVGTVTGWRASCRCGIDWARALCALHDVHWCRARHRIAYWTGV